MTFDAVGISFLLKLALFLAVALELWFAYVAVLRKSALYVATVLVVSYQSFLLIGTILLADMTAITGGAVRAAEMSVSLAMLILGAYLIQCTRRSRTVVRNSSRRVGVIFDIDRGVYWFAVIGIGVIGITIGLIQNGLIGYNVPIEAIKVFLKSQNPEAVSVTYNTLRKGIKYNLEVGWVAPGYVSQFTWFLLPLVVILSGIRYFRLRRPADGFFFGVLTLSTVYLLIVDGRRGPIFMFAVWTLFLFSKRLGPLGRLRFAGACRRFAIGLGVVALCFFIVASILMGRDRSTAVRYHLASGGVGARLIATGVDLFDRVVLTTPRAQIELMSEIEGRPLGFGSGWLRDLSILLPGYQPGLASEFYEILHGSSTGSSPPDLWTSIWLEWGLIGTIVVPFFLGILVHSFSLWASKRPIRVSRCVTLCLASFSLMWIGSPIQLFNAGFVTFMLYLGVLELVTSLDRSISEIKERESTGNRVASVS